MCVCGSWGLRADMLDTESQWSEALASNNVRVIIRWLRVAAEGEADVQEVLPTFSCWVQRTSEFAKKELLTLCFSRCQGLWMFLDRSSFSRVHMLLQRLRNLLTLAQWARNQLSSAHLWHGVGVPCMMCRDTFGSSDVRRCCWNREQRALKKHIWLGRLVQWWGIMGLLPKYPEAHEVKRISQMWKEMDHSHRKACPKTPGWEEGETGRFRSLIQGMVTQLDRQHGCIWASEDFTDQCYPPPNLQALLKLVLVPHIDNMSVQALLMYFVLDMANFLQCKDDLLLSFCHAFTIPSSFSQQIRAFWLFDHGHIKASMELLLSPRAAAPCLSWQHHCIIHCLLMRKQPQLALRYFHWTRPAIVSAEDAKLCAEVLLQNSCVSEAWTLLKTGHTESEDMVTHFLQACNKFGLCAEALKYVPAGYKAEGESVTDTPGSQLPLIKTNLIVHDHPEERPPCPLSAELYQAQRVNSVSPEEVVQLVRKAVMEVRKPHPKIREVVWPEHVERKSNSREMFLSTQALRHLMPSPSPLQKVEETATDEPEEEQPVHHQPPESPVPVSSSEDLSCESVASFTSASSLPLLRQDRSYVYESTLTLQRISILLTDGENQCREEEEEEIRSPFSVEALPEYPEPTVTVDGATDSVFLSNLNKEALQELPEEGEDVKTEVFSLEDILSAEAVSGPSMNEILLVNKSIKDSLNQPSLCQPQMEGHGVRSPDDEKMSCCEGESEEIAAGLPDVTDLWSSAAALNQEDQTDRIPHDMFSFSPAAPADCFLEDKLHQKTYKHQEHAVASLNQGFSFVMSETTKDLLTDLHHSLLSEDPAARGSNSAGMCQQDIPLLTPVCTSEYLTQLQQISDSCLTCSPTTGVKTTCAPSDSTSETAPEAWLKMDGPCMQSTSACLNHCKMGIWWKQDLKTSPASSGLLCPTERGAAISSDKKGFSLAPSQPYSYSLTNFTDFSAKQKGDNRDGKQADKEEPASWSSLEKGSQGAIRSGRTRLRKGKRVKRA